MNEHLIVFTRYPQPGRTKTRLIPALGPVGAASVQRQMTEHCLRTVAQLVQLRPVQVWICYAGADELAFRGWLGEQWHYWPQAEGDLGDRMATAFQQAFSQAGQRVVTIGIDCPDITPALLCEAFEAIKQQDLVLGPASDGGYYLIGLRQLWPSLFAGLAWGSDSVRAETLVRAAQAGLAVAQLEMLTDVDHPEDLPHWARHQANDPPGQISPSQILPDQIPPSPISPDQPQPAQTPLISIIMPVRNEAAALAAYLPELQQGVRQSEMIVVDGESEDNSAIIAQALGVRVVRSIAQRAVQMNAGAAIAQGEILLFLHGDSRLPEDFEDQVSQTLAQANVVAGAFELRIDGEGPGLRLVEWGVNQRSRRLGLPYGDQGLFVTRSQFEAMDGFAKLPIMEDFELVQRLKRLGQIAIAPAAVVTSGRRWQRLGIGRTTLVNQGMLLGYALGIAPERLARWYRGKTSG